MRRPQIIAVAKATSAMKRGKDAGRLTFAPLRFVDDGHCGGSLAIFQVLPFRGMRGGRGRFVGPEQNSRRTAKQS